MLYRSIMAFILIMGLASHAHANQVPYHQVPEASIVGSGVLSLAFWDVYKATLYAPHGQWDPNKPFALSIKYYRDIKGNDIADATVKEIRKQGYNNEIQLATWHTQLKSTFPDVKNGTVLSAVYRPNKQTIFYHGNEVIGTINDRHFGKYFFNIWLDEKTTKPDLRRALLGLR